MNSIELSQNGKQASLLVTGAASGLGLAACELWRERNPEGALYLLDMNENMLQSAAEKLQGEVHCFVVNVRDSEKVGRAFSEIASLTTSLDGLVNCAGIALPADTATVKDEEWESVIDIHLNGALRVSRAAYPFLKGGGAIVNLGSVASVLGLPRRASYNAAKHAIVGLTKSLAVEWANQGIRVNAVGPGYILTELTRNLVAFGELDPRPIEERTPLGRWAEPREIAEAVCFLLSSSASFITGHLLMVDGGMTVAGDWYEK